MQIAKMICITFLCCNHVQPGYSYLVVKLKDLSMCKYLCVYAVNRQNCRYWAKKNLHWMYKSLFGQGLLTNVL